MPKQDISEIVKNSQSGAQTIVPFSSNQMRLSPAELLIAAVCVTVLFALIPVLWQRVETFESGIDDNYRVSYEKSNDYWIYRRYCRSVSRQNKILIIGDSVIWGQYVKKEHTLSHYLNEQCDRSRFANLGLDGLHQVAMLGLLKYYGKAISGKSVILHFNALWMNSKEYDLRGEKEFRFHHTRLAPQFLPRINCYNASYRERFGVISERNIPFFSLISHLKINCFENMDIQNWTIENPYNNPLAAVSLEIPLPENKPHARPISWTKRGLSKQDFPWVMPEESFQWGSFVKAIKLLRARDNDIFIVIGPFNTYLLTEQSHSRYNTMKDKMEKWLDEIEVSYHAVSNLPSEYYADASHPLKEGYAKIAEELLETESFREWMKKSEER